MATSKDDIKHGTAQARHSAEEPTRVAYKADTPLEGGMAARSEILDLYPAARSAAEAAGKVDKSSSQQVQSQLRRRGAGGEVDDAD